MHVETFPLLSVTVKRTLLRPTFEETAHINEVEIALDYIAKRSNSVHNTVK